MGSKFSRERSSSVKTGVKMNIKRGRGRTKTGHEELAMSIEQFPHFEFGMQHKTTTLKTKTVPTGPVTKEFMLESLALLRFIDWNDNGRPSNQTIRSDFIIDYGTSNLARLELQKLLKTFKNLILWNFRVIEEGRTWFTVGCEVDPRIKGIPPRREIIFN